MRIVVISHPDTPERMALQRFQFTRLKLDYSRLSAFTAATVEDGGMLSRLPVRERATLRNHMTAWEDITANGPALIVEDDALLADSVPDILHNIATLPGIDHLSLAVRGRRKLLGRNRIPVAHGGVAIRRLYLDWQGSAAYILWPSGAQKLLARARRDASPVDWLLASAFDLKSYQTDPACAVQLDMLEHYDLADEMRFASGLRRAETRPVSAHHMARQLRSLGAKTWRRLRYAAVASRVAVPVRPESFSF